MISENELKLLIKSMITSQNKTVERINFLYDQLEIVVKDTNFEMVSILHAELDAQRNRLKQGSERLGFAQSLLNYGTYENIELEQTK